MTCYYQGCLKKGITKEHIPPRSFFPKGEKEQLLTVRSCELHNNRKASDDQYVLAHICMNAYPTSKRAEEIFLRKIKPQLSHNNGAFNKLLTKGYRKAPNAGYLCDIDVSRFNEFFTALSCGIIFKTCDQQVPESYFIHHHYPNLANENGEMQEGALLEEFGLLISGEPMKVLDFGKPNTKNENIYSVKVFGIPGFRSSITVVHLFYGHFKVVSLLTKIR